MQTRLDDRGTLVADTRVERVGADSEHKGLYAAATQYFSSVAAGFVRAHKRRAAIRDLSRLSDRQLRDVGIRREQIREVVDGMLARADGQANHDGR